MALILRVQYINLTLLHYQKRDCNFTPFHKQQNTKATLKGQTKCIKLPQIYSRYDQPKPHESRESCLGMVRARSTEGCTAHTHARARAHTARGGADDATARWRELTVYYQLTAPQDDREGRESGSGSTPVLPKTGNIHCHLSRGLCNRIPAGGPATVTSGELKLNVMEPFSVV